MILRNSLEKWYFAIISKSEISHSLEKWEFGIVSKNKISQVSKNEIYLKKNNLQDPEAKQFFTQDKKMAKVFGKDKIKAFSMAKFLNSHLKELKA